VADIRSHWGRVSHGISVSSPQIFSASSILSATFSMGVPDREREREKKNAVIFSVKRLQKKKKNSKNSYTSTTFFLFVFFFLILIQLLFDLVLAKATQCLSIEAFRAHILLFAIFALSNGSFSGDAFRAHNAVHGIRGFPNATNARGIFCESSKTLLANSKGTNMARRQWTIFFRHVFVALVTRKQTSGVHGFRCRQALTIQRSKFVFAMEMKREGRGRRAGGTDEKNNSDPKKKIPQQRK
jgi:hypothetical protein